MPKKGEKATYGRGDVAPCRVLMTILATLLVILTFPFSLCCCIKSVNAYERFVIFRLGRLLHGGPWGPGVVFVNPFIDQFWRVDLRTVTYDVPPQEILSRDSVTLRVDAVVYYRLQDANMAVLNVSDAHECTHLLASTTLRNILSTKVLGDILADREGISLAVQAILDEATIIWGVKVERVEIKKVVLPASLHKAMAAEAEAAREARAHVIAAEGEQMAVVALREAADILTDSPAALQLRYLQTLNTISIENNSTIVVPLPMELLRALDKVGKDNTSGR